jgi:hypothetical protein
LHSCPRRGSSRLPEERVLLAFVMPEKRVFWGPGLRNLRHTRSHVCQIPDSHLCSEPVVVWGVWIPFVKLSEFVQSARGEVVVRPLRPVSTFQIIKPLDKVEDATVVAAPSLDT